MILGPLPRNCVFVLLLPLSSRSLGRRCLPDVVDLSRLRRVRGRKVPRERSVGKCFTQQPSLRGLVERTVVGTGVSSLCQ